MKAAAAAILLALAMAACSSAPPPQPQPEPLSPTVSPTQPPHLAPTDPARDACGAAPLQSLIGRPRSEIPVPVDPSRQRVACATCPVTQDFRPDRLNFLFDAQTGLITQVRCG
jgi:hypothetical protein